MCVCVLVFVCVRVSVCVCVSNGVCVRVSLKEDSVCLNHEEPLLSGPIPSPNHPPCLLASVEPLTSTLIHINEISMSLGLIELVTLVEMLSDTMLDNIMAGCIEQEQAIQLVQPKFYER